MGWTKRGVMLFVIHDMPPVELPSLRQTGLSWATLLQPFRVLVHQMH